METQWERFLEYSFMWRRPYASYHIDVPITDPGYMQAVLERTKRLISHTCEESDVQASKLANVYVTEPEGWANLIKRADNNPMAYKIMKAVCMLLRPILVAPRKPTFSSLSQEFQDRVYDKAVLYARWRLEPDPKQSVAPALFHQGIMQLQAWSSRCWLDPVPEPNPRGRPLHQRVLRNAILVRAVHDIDEYQRINSEFDTEKFAFSIVAEQVELDDDTVAKIWRQGGLQIVQFQSVIQARLDQMNII